MTALKQLGGFTSRPFRSNDQTLEEFYVFSRTGLNVQRDEDRRKERNACT